MRHTPPHHDQASEMDDENVSMCEGKVSCLQAFTPKDQAGQELRLRLVPPIIGGGMVCIDAEGRFFPHVLSGSHATLATLTLHLARAEGPEQSQTRRTDPRRGRIFGFMFSRAWRGWQGRGHTTL